MRIALAIVVLFLAGAAAGWWWVEQRAAAALEARTEVEVLAPPVPWPLDPEETARLLGLASPDAPLPEELAVDLDTLAREEAEHRGRVVAEQLGCGTCHGADLGGSVVVDDAWTGRVVAPDLTTLAAMWSPEDWTRLLRHGVRPDGTEVFMPVGSLAGLPDRDLSDLVAWLRTRPDAGHELAPSDLGPGARWRLARGRPAVDGPHGPERYSSTTSAESR